MIWMPILSDSNLVLRCSDGEKWPQNILDFKSSRFFVSIKYIYFSYSILPIIYQNKIIKFGQKQIGFSIKKSYKNHGQNWRCGLFRIFRR